MQKSRDLQRWGINSAANGIRLASSGAGATQKKKERAEGRATPPNRGSPHRRDPKQRVSLRSRQPLYFGRVLWRGPLAGSCPSPHRQEPRAEIRPPNEPSPSGAPSLSPSPAEPPLAPGKRLVGGPRRYRDAVGGRRATAAARPGEPRAADIKSLAHARRAHYGSTFPCDDGTSPRLSLPRDRVIAAVAQGWPGPSGAQPRVAPPTFLLLRHLLHHLLHHLHPPYPLYPPHPPHPPRPPGGRRAHARRHSFHPFLPPRPSPPY
jgi:hypothetical protein